MDGQGCDSRTLATDWQLLFGRPPPVHAFQTTAWALACRSPRTSTRTKTHRMFRPGIFNWTAVRDEIARTPAKSQARAAFPSTPDAFNQLPYVRDTSGERRLASWCRRAITIDVTATCSSTLTQQARTTVTRDGDGLDYATTPSDAAVRLIKKAE